MSHLLAAALDMANTGLCVIPTKPDGTKSPAVNWTDYQTTHPTEDQIINWFTDGHYDGLGVVTGATSGNLEMLEFEGRAINEGILDQWVEIMVASGLADLRKHLRGWVERSPSGGVHIHYRVDGEDVPGNTKLARRPSTPDELTAWKAAERAKAAEIKDDHLREQRLNKIESKTEEQVPQTLVETRGEGGFTITAPSNGRTHPTGKPWVLIKGSPTTIPTITPDERQAIHDICRMLDQMPEPEAPAPVRRTSSEVLRDRREGRIRPGDDYNQRATWNDLLTPHGWTHVYTRGNVSYWRRPGKNIGISATTGRNDADNLYVFSTSTEFDTETPYSKFAAVTLLEHGSNYQTAAKALQQAGYGTQPDQQPPPATTSVTQTPPPDENEDQQDATTYDQFWNARPVLTRICNFARARRAGPWAVLGAVLLRVTMATPPFVTLPGLVGGPVSLNLYIGLVGPSGSGKGAATAAARDCIDIGRHIETIGIGSGEGITHSFMHYLPPEEKGQKGTVEQHTQAVMFTAAEIGTVGALVSRQASTLLDELKKAWMGEALGFGYVDKFKRLPMREHIYRLGLLAGIQPLRADALLQDTAGGTPQRWLWMPTTDPDAPTQRPDEPEPIAWTMPPKWPMADYHTHLSELPVCDRARKEIDDAQLARLQGHHGTEDAPDVLDGHLLLAQLKVAAALAILEERADVIDEDWSLAGTIIAKSTATRSRIQQAMDAKRKQVNAARGKDEAERQLIVAETMEDRAMDRAVRGVKRRLKSGQWIGHSELRKSLDAKIRQHFDTAVNRLIDAQALEVEQVEYRGQPGFRYRLVEEGHESG